MSAGPGRGGEGPVAGCRPVSDKSGLPACGPLWIGTWYEAVLFSYTNRAEIAFHRGFATPT